MIPTITDLNKEKIGEANDTADDATDVSEVVSVAKTAANDTVDAVEFTMDRIMARHNGHKKRYRDRKGRFTAKEKVAANDKRDAVEETMDRIMARHNGNDEVIPKPANDLPSPAELTMDRIMARHNDHDNAPGRMDAANENRIIHDYNSNIPQVERKEPLLVEEQKSPALDVLSAPEPEDRDVSQSSKPTISGDNKVVDILRSIDNNTFNAMDILKLIRQDIEDIFVETQKAREKDLEKGQGYIASSKDSISSMDQKGKPEEKKGLLESLAGATTGLVTTAVVGAAGFAGQYLMPQTQKDNAGGFDGSGQTAGQKASGRHGGVVPGPVPRPDVLGAVSEKYESGGVGVATVSSGLRDEGGASYGKHQLSAKDGMPGFLSSPEGRQFKSYFNGLRPGTSAFNARYKQIAKTNGAALDKAEQDYFARVYYTPTALYAQKRGIDVNQRGIQEALYSMLQHGMQGRKKIIDNAVRSGVNLHDPDAVIRALYDQRGKYASHFASYDATVGRYNREVKDALAVQHASKGAALNRASAQQNSKPNVVVVNSPTTNVNNNNNVQTKSAQPKARVPQPRTESWMEAAKNYFGF